MLSYLKSYKTGVFFLALFIVMIGFQSQIAVCQEWVLKGRVIDAKTKLPISAVHVATTKGFSAISDKAGFFEIKITSLPVEVQFSHLSYGQAVISIEKEESKEIKILMNQLVNKIDEVQVAGERLRILTKESDFSIMDIEFGDEFLWMIVLKDNKLNNCRLVKANIYGDTISSIGIESKCGLHKSVFGNVHLATQDSIFQLYSPDEIGIAMAYGERKERFFQIVDKYVESFNGKLVYIDDNEGKQKAKIFYIQEGAEEPYQLSCVEDSLEKIRRKMEQITGSMWIDFQRSRYYKKGTKVAEICDPKIKVPMFSMRDTLYVLNMVKDSLLKYDPNGKFSSSVAVSFHKDMKLWDFSYHDINFLVDHNSNICYALFKDFIGWQLGKLNTSTGLIEKFIDTPKFPGMTDVHVHKNAVYFLYYEKVHPYYVRLFRYQL